MTALADAHGALEGGIPATIATMGSDGFPNVSFISDVTLVDDEHVCFSNQFLQKTKANLLANPRAHLTIVEPGTFRQFQLQVEYVREETEGALFDEVSAKIEAIASMSGMSGVFALRGVMIMRALEVTLVNCAG